MAYSFYLDGYALPFAPPSMRLSWPGRNETIDLINDGEANIPRAPGLQQIEFEARIPNEAYSFATYPTGWIDADRFRALLESLHGGKQPFRFIASRAMGSKLLFDTNLMVTLESWDMNEDWEEGFDAIFPITLKAYKAFATKTAQIVAPAASAPMIVTSQTRAERRYHALRLHGRQGRLPFAHRAAHAGRFLPLARDIRPEQGSDRQPEPDLSGPGVQAAVMTKEGPTRV